MIQCNTMVGRGAKENVFIGCICNSVSSIPWILGVPGEKKVLYVYQSGTLEEVYEDVVN